MHLLEDKSPPGADRFVLVPAHVYPGACRRKPCRATLQSKGRSKFEEIGSLCQLGVVRIIIEKHAEGYVGYPAGIQGVVVGQGNAYEEALSDVQSAIRFHIESFGRQALNAYVGEANV